MRPRAYAPSVRALLLSIGLFSLAHAGPVDDAKSAEASGDRLGALDAWKRAIEADPTQAASYVALGRLQIRMKDPNGAVATFEQLVEKVPSYARGQYRLAFALRKAKRYREAADAYQTYIGVAPADPDARFGLAESLRQLGDREGALSAYRAYVRLELRPTEAKWVQRANEEIARLESSVAVEPGDERPLDPEPPTEPAKPPVVPATAAPSGPDPDAQFAQKNYRGATSGYTRLVQQRPDAAVARYRLGLAAASGGDLDTGERSAAHAERLDPGNPTASDLAAIARARRAKENTEVPSLRTVRRALQEGRVRTAERLAAKALAKAKQKDRPKLLRARAEALLALGRVDEALRAFKGAAAAGTAGPATYLELGEVALLAGDARGGRYYLELAASAGAADHPAVSRARAKLADLPRGTR